MPRTPTPRTLPVLAAVALVGGLVYADVPMTTPPSAIPPASAPASAPASQPSTQPMSAKDVLSDMLKPGTADKLRPLKPVQGQVPYDATTVNPLIPGQRPITLRREGSYVVDRTGRITRSADGRQYEFNFDADAQTLQDPPMVLLPNLTLMMVQDELKGASRDLRFRITGQVTEYLGRNYVLLQKAVVVADNAGLGGS